ncbi:MAG: hypothetical protein GY789_16165 [Hyphomicrobiales bacterium]|nr:hypothetical protein [Hyphomicrobiales bacterium]MCP5002109.1 hypothetical protein [Hyphomicrobiales bacterium]
MAFLLPRAHRIHSKAYVKNTTKKRPSNFDYFDDDTKDGYKSDVRFFTKVKPKRGIRSASVAKRSFGKPDYKGPIYVLLSPGSRSNSTNVASSLKRLRNATIVGSVTANDSVTGCARASDAYTLTHTKFLLQVPELCFRNPGNRFNEEHTLDLDIEVDPLDAQLQSMNSMILKTALEHIDKSAAY